MKITAKDTTILKKLNKGKIPLIEIAEELGVTENTVRNRIHKLEEEGTLEICGVVDPDKLPGHQVAMIGIKTSGTDSISTCEKLAGLQSVISLSLTTGRYDIIMLAFLKEELGIREFYSEEISKISGIESVEIFVVQKSFNLKIPYNY